MAKNALHVLIGFCAGAFITLFLPLIFGEHSVKLKYDWVVPVLYYFFISLIFGVIFFSWKRNKFFSWGFTSWFLILFLFVGISDYMVGFKYKDGILIDSETQK